MILFICLTLKNQGISQSMKLPDEIQLYYKTKNFISLYSSQEERNLINILYLRGENISSINDVRIKRMAGLIFTTWQQYFQPEFSAFNNRPAIPSELLLPMAYKIKNWQQDGSHITVTTYSYSFSSDMIHKAINSYTPDMKPSRFTNPGQEGGRVYLSQQIHEWNLENGHWVKYPVMKVLVD